MANTKQTKTADTRSREEKIAQKLKTRTPLARQSILGTVPLPGMVQRWVSDKPGRVEAFVAAGWEFVGTNARTGRGVVINPDTAEEMENRKAKRSGNHPDGSPLFLYLMCIEQEIFEHAQAEKAGKIDAVEKTIRRAESTESGEQRGYVKQETDFSVSIQ